jgi:predicted ATPase
MIERLYLDNIRSFVNFEWKPERLALLLGSNGAGKTALLETLRAVQGFVGGMLSVSEAFPTTSRTRWDTRTEQTVEVDARLPNGLYRYRLVIVHDPEKPDRPLVKSESLHHEEQPIVEVDGGELRVHRGTELEALRGARPTRSAIDTINRGAVLGAFQAWVYKIWLLRPDPRAMQAQVDRRRPGAPWLSPNLSNFASWYPHQLASSQRAMFMAMEALEPILPGLVELRVNQGELEACFEREGATTSYSFDELSDGERALIALYVIMYSVAMPGRVLFLDEADNYVALREIQPWLAELAERALKSDGPQVILVSHHPEVLNFLAPERGFRMFREGNGPTRIERFHPQVGLSPDETIARGWDAPR